MIRNTDGVRDEELEIEDLDLEDLDLGEEEEEETPAEKPSETVTDVFSGLPGMEAPAKTPEPEVPEHNTPKVEAPAVEAAPALEAPAENTVEADDGELIAVIAAAIAAFDFGGSEKPVKIKSIRRVSGWKSAARTEQVYKF